MENNSVVNQLRRIADALERAYPKNVHPSGADLLGDPNADPIDFIVETWGETREDAEKIVATTRARED